MNLKATVAKIYLPPSLKVKGLLGMYFNAAFFIHKEMEKEHVKTSEILRKAYTEAGKVSAQTLKKELGLKNTFEDAVNSWIIGSKAMNVKISLENKGDEVIFNHLYCPMWEYFREKGEILCEDVCIPVAEMMAKEICPDVKVTVIRKPDAKHTCIKGLKR